MAFQFPDPQTTAEFTADNGITYSWDVDDSKWQVKTTAALDDIRQDIIELEEEIDAIAPSVERGFYRSTAYTNIPRDGEFMLRTLTGKTIDYGDENIVAVELSKVDDAGVSHTYADTTPGQLIQLFEEGVEDFGLYQIESISGTDPSTTAVTFAVTPISGLGEATEGNLARLKIFSPPEGGTASEFVQKKGDTMSGDLAIDTSTESTNTEAGLALTGSRADSINSAATITFKNNQTTAAGYLTYRSGSGGHWFAFNRDVDLNNKGLHTVAQIRLQNGGYIGSGSNQRIKIRTGGSNDGQAGTEIQRIGDAKRAFAIKGKAAGSSSITDFFWAYGNSGTGGDAINYTGKMTSNDNIVNKGYVDSKMPTYKITKSNGNYYVQ